jgi:hypothetical protein
MVGSPVFRLSHPPWVKVNDQRLFSVEHKAYAVPNVVFRSASRYDTFGSFQRLDNSFACMSRRRATGTIRWCGVTWEAMAKHPQRACMWHRRFMC